MALQKVSNVFNALLGVAICVFVLSFPFPNKCSVIALWIMGSFALISFAVHRKLNLQWIFLFPIIMFAFRFISWKFSPELSFGKIDTSLSLFTMPFIFSLFRFNAVQVQRCLQAIFCVIVMCVVLLWGSFVQHIVREHLFMEALQNPKAYVSLFLTPPWWWHPSFVSVILVFVVPLAFYLRFGKGIPSLLLWATILLTIPLIYFTGARIGIVASLILLLFAFIFYLKRFLAPERAVILLLFVALALAYRHLPYDVLSDPIRKDLRTLGTKTIAEHPLWGSGVYSMEGYIQSAEFTAQHNVPAYPFNHFHCTPIDEVVQFGFVGGAVLAAFLICIFVLAIRRRDFLLFAFLLLYIPFMLVESPFMSVKGIMPMMFWLCLLVSTQRERLYHQIELL